MSPPGDRRIVALLHAVFVLAGMATTLLGPMMPLLMARWSLTDAAAGALFTAQFAGQTLSTFGSTFLTSRIGDRNALALGMFVTAAGIAAVALSSWPYGAIATFVYGLGLGIVLPLTNFIVAALRPATAASALSLLNVSWGVGAVLWPMVVRLTMAVAPADAAPLAVLGALTAALAIVLVGVSRWPERGARAAAVQAGAGERRGRAVGIGGLFAGFAVATYLFVGAEASVGGWIAEFTRRTAASAGALWTVAPTVFWGAETLGRLAAPLVLRRVSETRVLGGGLCIACAAVILLLLTGTGEASRAIAGAAIAGAGLAPVFPLIIAAMNREVAPVAPRLMGPLFAMGGLGGATLPWMVGMTSTATGSLQAGLAVPLAAILGILALLVMANRTTSVADRQPALSR